MMGAPPVLGLSAAPSQVQSLVALGTWFSLLCLFMCNQELGSVREPRTPEGWGDRAGWPLELRAASVNDSSHPSPTGIRRRFPRGILIIDME